MEWKPCVKCGKPSNHVNLPDRFLCCGCYVSEGNPPADWHPDCMKVSKSRRQAERYNMSEPNKLAQDEGFDDTPMKGFIIAGLISLPFWAVACLVVIMLMAK